MIKWMIRFLLISLIAVGCYSCKSYQLKQAVPKIVTRPEFQNPYFSNPETDYVYKAHIEVYGHKAGGVFVAKRLNDSVHRVVFTTDFGNKILDFEISETDFKVHYVLEELDRKMLLHTLRDDFRLLLKVHHTITDAFENESFEILKASQGNGYLYFHLDKKNQQLVKLIAASKRKEKVVFEFESKNSTFAETISINHKNIQLQIELKQIIN
ncbi:hypothetical protein [Flavobacterium suncheonense]|uniref:Lipoprotein n=1 Tax=Flavobacterium suncheonense GH29-5 = DSM 17707 TaxID=1121899 RepID=A0A0A2MBR5_9FLAO|nr:hypothetical protein [Flavobacterium suncheonense]KGO89679.1 hypothetical protein Q764_05650 [Flavobacterium suncheonense GH29-5 = DSM 17707]